MQHFPRLRQALTIFWGGFHMEETTHSIGEETQLHRRCLKAHLSFSCPQNFTHRLRYVLQRVTGSSSPVAERCSGRHRSPSKPRHSKGCSALCVQALEEFSGRQKAMCSVLTVYLFPLPGNKAVAGRVPRNTITCTAL